MSNRKKLADILRAGDEEKRLQQAWDYTEAAADFTPLPTGEYECRVLGGEPFKAKTGTPGYKLVFEVAEGEFVGRRVWHDLWLTKLAMPMTKRDLAKLGVKELKQLDSPLPRASLSASGWRCGKTTTAASTTSFGPSSTSASRRGTPSSRPRAPTRLSTPPNPTAGQPRS